MEAIREEERKRKEEKAKAKPPRKRHSIANIKQQIY